MVPSSGLELDEATMRRLGEQITELVARHIASLREQPAQHPISRRDAERLILAPAPEAGEPFDRILEFLRERVFPYHAREPHPHFMGYIPSSPTFPAVLGDWLASGFNFFAGVWPVAAGPNAIELTVIDWFRRWLGLPDGAAGLLTSGGSAATLNAVVTARHARAPAPDALPRLTVYTSDQAHSSVTRAAWIAGVPRENVRSVPTGDRFRLDVPALGAMISADRRAGLIPFLAVASAGTTNTGAVDPLAAVADVCSRERLWMHVDAAFGGFAALLDRERPALAGIERADSVTLDPHKWLFVPFECGCLLARDPAALESAFSVHPEYLNDVRAKDRDVNFADWGEQLTRSSHALKVWMSVHYFGLAAIREAIAAGIRRAEYAEERVRGLNGFEVLSPAQLGIVCFRVHPRGLDDPAALDRLNDAVNAAVNGTGRFLMSSTRLRGRFSLRLCTHVHRMTLGDVDEVLDAVVRAADEARRRFS